MSDMIRILATKRGGEQVLIEIDLPFAVSASATDDKFTMYYLHDANGTDHYFDKDDGTYDGWGTAMCGPERERRDRTSNERNTEK